MITATQKIVKIGEKAKCRFTSIDDEVDVIVKQQGAKDYELVVEKDGKEYLARQMYFGGLVVNDGPSAAHLAARKEEEAKRKAVLASLQEVLRLSGHPHLELRLLQSEEVPDSVLVYFSEDDYEADLHVNVQCDSCTAIVYDVLKAVKPHIL